MPHLLKRIGLISDTHGLLRKEAKQALIGSDIIIHAGDIGKLEVLDELNTIAQVFAIRGNTDHEPWAKKLPLKQYIRFKGLNIYVIHDISRMDNDLSNEKINLVVYGHSHKPMEKRIKDVVYVNPGSAGPKRFRLPISVAVIEKQGNHMEVIFINL